jgi:hypothetical protein
MRTSQRHRIAALHAWDFCRNDSTLIDSCNSYGEENIS